MLSLKTAQEKASWNGKFYPVQPIAYGLMLSKTIRRASACCICGIRKTDVQYTCINGLYYISNSLCKLIELDDMTKPVGLLILSVLIQKGRKYMKTSLKYNQKNPFRLFFLSVAAICCIVFSIVFYYIGHVNEKTLRNQHDLSKAQTLMQDWEAQVQLMTDTAARIASSHVFHPRYFEDDVTKEISLLENLRQFSYYLPLTDEYFLFYGNDYIYRSHGTTLNVDVFLQTLIADEKDRQMLRDELAVVNEPLSGIWKGPDIVATSDDIYVLFSFRVNSAKGYSNALCCFLLERAILEERFTTIGGGIDGVLCLYRADTLIYANRETTCMPNQKGVLTVVSSDGLYSLCYMPDKVSPLQNRMLPLLLLLVSLDVLFVLFITTKFADRAYKPILSISSKYKGLTSNAEEQYDNALEEINYLIESVLQNNEKTSQLLKNKQKQLKDQLLRLLLEGKYSDDLEANLDQMGIHLPGPYYFVLGISFEEEKGITDDLIVNMQQELEQISEPADDVYVYTVCIRHQKQAYVICSIAAIDNKAELCETICGLAENCCAAPFFGIGNAYMSLSKLSASWLESIDNIHFHKSKMNEDQLGESVYEARELHRIITAMETGNECTALEALESYIEQSKLTQLSPLMQQYIFTEFMGKIAGLGRKHQLQISRQNISMLLSSRNVNDFEASAKKVIHDFCESVNTMKNQSVEEELHRIYEYINTHFTEYDISLEKIAEVLHVSPGDVRKAVTQYTGKIYKDYLIHLRIEYAKQLLLTEDLPISEICNKVGYGSVSYFIKLFRETTGVTPAKFKSYYGDES